MDKKAFSHLRNVEIEVTSACNRSCWFCAPGVPAERRVHPIEICFADVAAVLMELGDLGYSGVISLCGFGEPMMYSDLIPLVTFAKGYTQARVVLHTNGDVGQAGIRQFLRGTRVDSIVISNYELRRSWDCVSDEPRVKVLDFADRPRTFWHSRAGNIRPLFPEERARIEAARHRPCRRFRESIVLAADGYWITCCNDMRHLHRWHGGVADLLSNPEYLAMRDGLTGVGIFSVDRSLWQPCDRCGTPESLDAEVAP